MLARIDEVRELLNARDDVVEVQVQYTNGEIEEHNVESGDGSSLDAFISGVEWDQVKEIELEYANGEEYELDFDELEDRDDDDADEDDEEFDNDDEDDEDDDDDDEDVLD